MARPPKLSLQDKETIRRRLLAGEKQVDLAAEYAVNVKTISRIYIESPVEEGEPRLPVAKIKEAAQKSLDNDLNDPVVRELLEKAGQSDRDLFQSHKADLLETVLQLNIAVKISAQNAAKLARMSKNHFDKLEDDSPLNSENRLIKNDAMELQVDSNEAIKAPMKFFEIATKQPPPPPEDKPVRVIGGLPDIPYE